VNWIGLVAFVVAVAVAAPAAAQTFAPDTVDLAAARKEGAVTWYTSTPVATAQKIANLFQDATGIRSSSSAPGARPCCGASCRRSMPGAWSPT
jgi:hypothetical protein